MRVSLAARSTSPSCATEMAFRPMPSASTNPGACNWEEIALWVCFAITICPTLSASFTVAWTRRPPRRISTVECVISEKPYRAISPSRFVFLDGENAWEYYPGNGRALLCEFYGRIQADQDFRALTASEAIAAAGEIPTITGIFPASWINANFDVWIGHAEDVEICIDPGRGEN